MTKDEAIAYFVPLLTDEHKFLSYGNITYALESAEAMSALTGKTWLVDNTPDNRYYIHPER